MALTLLQIIQSACRRIGINEPSIVISSSDRIIKQLMEFSIEEGLDQCRHPWQVLQAEATFTTVASNVQTSISAITSNFNYIVNDTIWNRSLRRPVYGPRTAQEWQQAKAMQINGPFNSFRIIGNNIVFYPAPTAGQSCYFEYVSEGWVNSSGNPTNTWADDTDTSYLDDQILILGTVWRFKQSKGLDFSGDMQKYQQVAYDLLAKDAGKPTLDMNGTVNDILPGIFVPAGNWSL